MFRRVFGACLGTNEQRCSQFRANTAALSVDLHRLKPAIKKPANFVIELEQFDQQFEAANQVSASNKFMDLEKRIDVLT